MERITIRHLESLCDRLNRVTGSPMKPWAIPEGETRHRGQVGNFHISRAYGGFCLHRMHNESGGVSSPLSTGHVPARELYNLMHAFLRGFEMAGESVKAGEA